MWGLLAACSEEQDVSTPLAVCALLLGNKDAAAAELGLGPSATREPDAGVQEFVMVRHG